MDTSNTKGLTYEIDLKWDFPESWHAPIIKNDFESIDIKEERQRESTKANKRLFLSYLQKGQGIISFVCKKTFISRATYYNWRQTDEEFRKEADEIMNAKPEVLEDRLYTEALQGKVDALKFMLSHIHKDYKKQSKSESVVHIYHHVDKKDESKNTSFGEMVWDEARRRKNVVESLKLEFGDHEFPLKPDGSSISEAELYRYEQYIRDWLKFKKM